MNKSKILVHYFGFAMKKILVMLLCLLASEKVEAQACNAVNPCAGVPATYYVDSTSGADSNAGSSISAPWQTLARVSGVTFSCPTTVLLKRGGTFTDPLTITSNNEYVDAYGSGTLPLLDGSISVTGWVTTGGGIYSKSISTLALGVTGLGNVSKNGVMLSFLPWTTDASTTFSGASNDSFSFQYVSPTTSTIYIKASADPAGFAYRASSNLYGIAVDGKSNISIANVQVARWSLLGISLNNCASCAVNAVTVNQGGGARLGANTAPSPDYQYAGNGIQFSNASTNGSVSNSTVSEIFDSGISPQVYVSNQTAGNDTFASNTIDRSGYAGIEISMLQTGGVGGSAINGVTLQSDTITNSGAGWSGRRFGSLGIGVVVAGDATAGNVTGVSINGSTISGSMGDGLRMYGKVNTVTIAGSSINNNTGNGVDDADASEVNLKLVLQTSLIYKNGAYGVLVGSPNSQGVVAYQDTFYDNTAINFGVTSNVPTTLQNNVFYADTAITDFYTPGTITTLTLDHNCYMDAAGILTYGGSSYNSVSSFSAATTFESHGSGGPVAMNSPSTGNFTLTSSSACKSLGATGLGVTGDYAGFAYKVPPSSGAYQF